MKKIFLICTILFFATTILQAQVGASNMLKMNSLMDQYGAKNVGLLKYESQFGLVHQNLSGYVDHYNIGNIGKITVEKVADGATVQFFCNSDDPCINHIGEKTQGRYLPSVSYFFYNEKAANTFAALAVDIIRKDFKKEASVTYSIADYKNEIETIVIEEKKKEVKKVEKEDFLSLGGEDERHAPEPQEVAPPKTRKVKDNLSLNAYGADDAEEEKDLSPFGKKLMNILQLAEKHQLAQIKGGASDGASQSKIKLPKAKRNYLNEYKNDDCFVAEFGTEKYYEDLEDLYYEIKDEIDRAIPRKYEPVDMTDDPVYENSSDQIFHTEYYNTEDPAKPSIVIRITPDGDKNTLFLRIGKR